MSLTALRRLLADPALRRAPAAASSLWPAFAGLRIAASREMKPVKALVHFYGLVNTNCSFTIAGLSHDVMADTNSSGMPANFENIVNR